MLLFLVCLIQMNLIHFNQLICLFSSVHFFTSCSCSLCSFSSSPPSPSPPYPLIPLAIYFWKKKFIGRVSHSVYFADYMPCSGGCVCVRVCVCITCFLCISYKLVIRSRGSITFNGFVCLFVLAIGSCVYLHQEQQCLVISFLWCCNPW